MLLTFLQDYNASVLYILYIGNSTKMLLKHVTASYQKLTNANLV